MRITDDKRKQLEEVAAAYQLIGLTVEESYLAAGLESRLLNEDKRNLREQGDALNTTTTPSEPLAQMEILTTEFRATQSVLEKLGYTCTQVSKADRAAAEFTRVNSATFIVKPDGSWSSPDMANKEVSNGATAFQLQILLGVTN
jgi:hypothetical protein